MKERVQKLMSQAGVASRRASEEMITQKRVTVNGKVVSLGDKADPTTDVIRVDGQKLKLQDVKQWYIVINKPNNVLSAPSTNSDDDRPTVRELIPIEGHLFSIGRLDADSDGLMVLTNNGELTNKLAHPRYEHTKTYKVEVYGEPSNYELEQWQDGVWLEEGKTAPCFVKVLESNTNRGTTILRVVMIEGKKRQIRRVSTKFGYPVKRLTRTHIGQLGLGTLRRGEWYELEEAEVAAMSEPAWELDLIKRRQKKVKANRKKRKK